MIHLGLLDRFKKNFIKVSTYRLITDVGEGFYSWNGNLYQSDIVRAAIRPKAQAVGKAIGKHVREFEGGVKINPEPYIRFLLEEPNQYMTGQMLQEKMTVQLMLNNNAFALIQRDENGFPNSIYPISSSNVDALQDERGELYLRFLISGKYYTFKYKDIIHLRRDFNSNDIFGDNPAEALTSLMEVVNTTDQGLVKAIKNSNIIRWLLNFNQNMRPEDLKRQTKDFVDSFLNTETSESIGAAATDAKFEAKQVEPNDYVPHATQMDRTTKRILSFFNTNEKIVQSNYTEDEWISYYEAEVEPTIMQLTGEYTRKIFSRRERGFGNKIAFENSNLTFASMQTKLKLVQFVDRGIMCPDEVRGILNMMPVPNGEGKKFIRRLDTAEIEGGDEDE